MSFGGGFLAELGGALKEKRERDQQAQDIWREHQADTLQKTIDAIKATGGVSPTTGQRMTPEEAQAAIAQATNELTKLYPPSHAPHLMKRLQDVFHKEHTPSPMDEQIPGGGSSTQAPGTGGTPTAPRPRATAPMNEQTPIGGSSTQAPPTAPGTRMSQVLAHPLTREQLIYSGSQLQKQPEVDLRTIHRQMDGSFAAYQKNPDGSVSLKPMPEYTEEDDVQKGMREYEEATGKKMSPEVAKKYADIRAGIEAKPVAPRATKPKTAWIRRNGQLINVQLDEHNQVVPGTENTDEIPPAYALEHAREGKYTYTDDSGNVHQIPVTTITRPVFPSGSPSAPAGTGQVKGQIEPGNINLNNRPVRKNPDGTISTVLSTSINVDGQEVLIPLIADDGHKMSLAEATKQYEDTGKHLGIFDSPASATAYAKQLSAAQGRQYSKAGPPSSRPEGKTSTAAKTPPAPETAAGIKAKGEKIIGYKGSQELKDLKKLRSKATGDYNTVTERLSTMRKSADVAKQGDGPAQVAIVANYIKSIVGGQGVRVTQTEWNQATQTAPWLERLGAHFTPDGYFSSTTSPLSTQQIDSMVREVETKNQAMQETLDQYERQIQEQKARDTGETAPSTAPNVEDEILKLSKQAKPKAQ